MAEVPATSYSTIFHCSQSGFICSLRLIEGLVSVGMFLMFYRGHKVINRERNNKLTNEDRLLYQLAMWQTLLLAVYYLLFEEFFMLATIRNFLIWISINVLHIFCLLYWHDDQSQVWISRGMYVLQCVNLMLWLFISLGEGSSLENADYQLGYNCEVMDWMVMSGILLGINGLSATLGYFKVNKLEWELSLLKEDRVSNGNKIGSAEQERVNIMVIMGSGLLGSAIMFGWDFLAFNGANSQASCNDMFSGNTIFRNLLCFLLKLITMQLNPAAIYYVMYFCRRGEFEDSGSDRKINEELVDYFDDGASDLNRTNSSMRRSEVRDSSHANNQLRVAS
jgi:hypothetical protein